MVTTSVYTVVFVIVFEQPRRCYKKEDSKNEQSESELEDESDDIDDIRAIGQETKLSWRKKCCSLNLIKHILVSGQVCLWKPNYCYQNNTLK